MRCPRCGNENPGTNRFCGMCGVILLPQAPVTAPAQTSAAQSAAAPTPPPAPPPPPAASEARPSISGPSFLGLNDPPPSAPAKRGSLSIDPNNAPSSRNLDYLLEDDEPKSGGAGKFLLIVVALLLVVGLGYLRYKNQGFALLSKSSSKPSAATQPADQDGNASTPPTATGANSPASSSPDSAQPSTAPASPASNPAPNPATAAPSAASPAPTADATTPPSNAANSKPAPPDASKDSSDAAPDTPAAAPPPAKPKPVATDEATKPAPKPSPIPARAAVDPVTEAQKYIYGKGVTQNCDRGLRILKPAADQANPKAMIEMGALYSAGLCTPRDLPTAYRWFALALRKDPNNQSVQSDLQKLWGEMTQPERQLAIRLSQ